MISKYPQIIAFILVISCINITSGQPFGRFASFDGVDDKFSTFSSVIPSNSDFTIEFWMKTCTDSIPSPTYAVLSNGNALKVEVFDVFSPSLRTHMLCLEDENNNIWCHQDHQYPSRDSLWHHIAITYSLANDHFEMYFDGIDGTLSPTPTYNFSPSFVFEVGDAAWAQLPSNKFRGYVDELRITNVIQYSGTFIPPQHPFTLDANTVGLWHFDDPPPVSMAMDDSNNNYHLNASGNPVSVPLDSIQIQGVHTLTAPSGFNHYQWIDCSNGNTPISGANSPSFAPTTNGTYAVIISDYVCPIQSNIINVTKVNQQSIFTTNELMIYPNPSSGLLNIKVEKNKAFSIALFDSIGHRLLTKKGNGFLQLNLKDLSSQVFWIRIEMDEKSVVKKIIHQNN